jgi:hypothetical protein
MNQYRCETCKCGCTYREIPAQRAFTRDMGCASHSDFQSERDKVLDKLCKICPFLDERPETCENCVVEVVRKELRQQAGEL